MNPVFKKLQTARLMLQASPITKSGKNKFAGYEYFELGDFMPTIQKIFGEVGLCGMVSYTQEMAYLTIQDTDNEGTIVFTSPMSSAALKGCHEVQNLGAVHTYLRRYLWVMAMEIVEHDALDAVTGSPVKAEVKAEAKKIPTKIVGDSAGWQIIAALKPDGDPQDWLNTVAQACSTALGMTEKEEDVMQIFKRNKKIFDAVKEQDAVFFKDLMVMFTNAKTSFNKE